MSARTTYRLISDNVFLALITIRFTNAIFLRTFFQPDEYYQALEPGLNFVSSRYGAWITWEWTQHLRSAIHPAIFSVAYYAADAVSRLFAKQDVRDNIILIAPKITQAGVAALGDYYTFKLSQTAYGKPELAFTTLALTILSPWQWFCSTRTFSNGLENTLTVAALCYWPFEWRISISSDFKTGRRSTDDRSGTLGKNLRISLLLAATATILRPTNILIWISLAAHSVTANRQERSIKPLKTEQANNVSSLDLMSRFTLLVREGILCGLVVLGVSAIIDRAFYGIWTLPALNFLYFNVIQSLAVFYGNNDWHYYLSQGYPLLLTTALPFALVGLYQILTNSPSLQRLPVQTQQILKPLAIICIVVPAALSILSHKEVRFIYPILGPLHVITALPVLEFFQPVFQKPAQQPQSRAQVKTTRGLIFAIHLSLNLIVAGYTSVIHNSGIIALPEHLRSDFIQYYITDHSHPESQPYPPKSQNMTVGILMPCHSIPWRSHLLHSPTISTPGIQAWALTCEPPLHITDPATKKFYLDEADVFYANPTRWLRKNMSRRPPWSFTDPKYNGHSEPGVYAEDYNRKSKMLWSAADSEETSMGLDITDLLPSLRTAPGTPPRMEVDGLVRRPWPHYLAFFAQLEGEMKEALEGSGYVECWRGFNSHWHDDWRRTGDVVVWCLFPERTRRQPGEVRLEGGEAKMRENAEQVENGRERRVGPERPGKQQVVRLGG